MGPKSTHYPLVDLLPIHSDVCKIVCLFKRIQENEEENPSNVKMKQPDDVQLPVAINVRGVVFLLFLFENWTTLSR